MQGIHNPMDRVDAGLKDEDVRARRKHQRYVHSQHFNLLNLKKNSHLYLHANASTHFLDLQLGRARKGARGGPDGIDDVAIGDEDQDWTRVEVDEYKKQQDEKDKTKARFDVNYVIVAGTIGALIGSLLGALQINKVWAGDTTINYEVATSTMWGLLVGCCFCSMSVSVIMCMYIYCNRDARWKAAQAARLEALRRKEQEIIERHDEFVYYDARRGQNRLCKAICCLHCKFKNGGVYLYVLPKIQTVSHTYSTLSCAHTPTDGKITSERIIYSANPSWPAGKVSCCAPSTWSRCCSFQFLRRLCCGAMERDVQALDYDLIFDISVFQSFYQCVCNTGTIVLHCEAAMDVSMQKSERKRIILAMQNENEDDLANALYTSANLKPLAAIVAQGRSVLERLRNSRREKCKADGTVYKTKFAMEKEGTNTSKNINVRDVVNPYAVMDDISYRIAKHQRIDQRNFLTDNATPMSTRSTVGQEQIDRRPPDAGEAKVVKN